MLSVGKILTHIPGRDLCKTHFMCRGYTLCAGSAIISAVISLKQRIAWIGVLKHMLTLNITVEGGNWSGVLRRTINSELLSALRND